MIHLENITEHPFAGWVHVQTDRHAPPRGIFAAGRYEACAYSGNGPQQLDVHVTIGPGQTLSIDPEACKPCDRLVPEPFGPDWFGGVPSIAGTAMEIVQPPEIDGAAIRAAWRLRVGPFVVDLWARWYPGEPWVHGEVMVTHSDPSHSAMVAVWGSSPLTWGHAFLHIPGRLAWAGHIIDPGTRFADGQARAFPVLFAFPQHIRTEAALRSLQCLGAGGVQGHGIHKLLHDGNPHQQPGARDWARQAIAGSIARLHNWAVSPHNITKRSNDTGRQADQCFVRAEALAHPAAVLPTYLEAMQWAKRPCHHLELNGDLLDRATRTGLRLWEGRPHFATSTDRLGKVSELTLADSDGWWGPDLEHWWFRGLTAAATYKPSQLLQRLLEHEAQVYLLQRLPPGNGANAAIFSARDVFLECLGVVDLWTTLRNASLATEVAQRFRQRWAGVILPWIAGKDVWDIRTSPSASVPVVPGWIPWQQGPAAYALDLVGRVLNIPEACAVALQGAKRVLSAFREEAGIGWVAYERQSVDGATYSRDGNTFAAAWMPPAVWTVLRHEPDHPKARAVWNHLMAITEGRDRSWIPPGPV